MNPFSRVTGRAADLALGLPGPAADYVLRRDVPVPMPDGSRCWPTTTSRPGRPGRCRWCSYDHLTAGPG